MGDSVYTREEYQYAWPVSMFDRIRQNQRRARWLFIIFGIVNMLSFALYGFAAALIVLGSVGLPSEGSYTLSQSIHLAFLLGFPAGAVVGILVTVATSVYAFARKGRGFIALSGAVPVVGSDLDTPQEIRRFVSMVEDMAIAGGMPAAEAYVMPSDAINAFAVGDRDANGAVVVTSGALRLLEPDELRGVVAHEMAHIRNRDSLLMTVAVVLAGVALVVPEVAARMASQGSTMGSGRNSRSGNGGGVLVLLGLALWVATYLISRLVTAILRAAISQEREYLADATAAQMTRNPEALARALHKIATTDRLKIPERMDRMEALFIDSPISPGKRTEKLFGTHPPIEERIRRLMAM